MCNKYLISILFFLVFISCDEKRITQMSVALQFSVGTGFSLLESSVSQGTGDTRILLVKRRGICHWLQQGHNFILHI